MSNHKLLGFIINLEKENLKKTQVEICELSKKFQKDDIFYVSGSWDIISKNEIASYVLNFRSSKNLTEELENIKNLSKNTDTKFKQTYFLISDKEANNSEKRKLNSIRRTAEVVECSQENFLNIFKEYNDKDN